MSMANEQVERAEQLLQPHPQVRCNRVPTSSFTDVHKQIGMYCNLHCVVVVLHGHEAKYDFFWILVFLSL